MKLQWVCPLSGDRYDAGDRRLAGRGNPPTIALAPGQGVCAMFPDVVEDDAESRPAGELLATLDDVLTRSAAPIEPQ
jgi:hypothetical protein